MGTTKISNPTAPYGAESQCGIILKWFKRGYWVWNKKANDRLNTSTGYKRVHEVRTFLKDLGYTPKAEWFEYNGTRYLRWRLTPQQQSKLQERGI